MNKKAKKSVQRAKQKKIIRKNTVKTAKKADLGEIEEVIKNIIAEIAEVDKKKIKPGTKFAEDLNIDSMMALEILTAIEKTYKIEIPEESLPKMTSLKEAMKLVKKLLV